MEIVVLPTVPDFREKVALATEGGRNRPSVVMATVPQFLLAFPLLLWSLQLVASCLHCDGRFLNSVVTLLKEMLPAELPDRDALIERHVQALADLHGTFLQTKYQRVLGAG